MKLLKYLLPLLVFGNNALAQTACRGCYTKPAYNNNASGLFGVDPYTGDAAAIDLDVHYQVDSLGSQQEYTK